MSHAVLHFSRKGFLLRLGQRRRVLLNASLGMFFATYREPHVCIIALRRLRHGAVFVFVCVLIR